jgi:hypothetical protein
MTRNVRRCPLFSLTVLRSLLLVLVSISISVVAQEKEKQKEKEPKGEAESAGKLVKVEGSVHCDKPDPAYAIEVPDRSGHALMLTHRRCTWTQPLAILDAKTKDGVAVNFTEKMEGTLHMHGFEVDTLDDGEKLTMRTMGQVLTEKGPAGTKGRWSFMRGTGKFKGIKGGGTYEGKLEADNGLTLDLEGAYLPAEMAGTKK